jgi:uncharacterized repeat protein (TIGR01451 family)
VVVTDYYPPQMVIDGGVNVGYWQNWTWEDFQEDNYFTVTLERLEPGWNVGINYNVVFPGIKPVARGQVFNNTASVTLDPNDTYPADNVSARQLGSGPDMFVEKTLVEGKFQPGEQVTYLLKFGNAQPGHASWWNMQGKAILIDMLPEGMSYVSAKLHWSKDQPEWSECTPVVDGQMLTWEAWALGSGVWDEILLTVAIAGSVQDGIMLTNKLEIVSDQPLVDLDPFPENNTGSVIGVVKVPTLSLFLPLIIR